MQPDLLAKLLAEHPELLRKGGIFRRSEVHSGAEFMRIVSLPRRTLDLEAVPDLSPLWAQPTSQMKLWPIQSAALLEAERCGGLFAALPVGSGKTLLAALLPDALQSRCAVILVPAQLKKKTLAETWPELQRHWRLPSAVEGRTHLVSYTQLERAPGDVLDRLQPDLVIADEAELLKNKEAARTSRFLRYFKERPETRFVAMSGTLTDKSIHDYAHLIRLALKDGCPLPRDYMTLLEWSEALDVSDNPRPAGALDRLCEDPNHAHESTRNRFGCRLQSTAGVVSVQVGFARTKLTVRRRSLSPPHSVATAIDRLRKTWVIGNPEAPDQASEEIVDDLSYSRFLRQLACGFYLRWDWPGGQRDHDWLSARAGWNSAVRHLLRYSRRPGMDSPLLVANAAIRGDLSREQQAAWEAWAAVKGRKRPPTVTVWIDTFVVEDCLRWLEAPGVVWYDHTAIGEALSKARGSKVIDRAVDIPMDGSSVVLSLHKFNRGVDGLQRVLNRCLYTSIPNAKTIEQSLGRLHREGQSRDVTADLLMTVPEAADWLEAAKERARYMTETRFGNQKILNCEMEGFD